MKSFKAVEATRRGYHADAARDSVHRSSLLAPVLPGAAVEVSFLNHFLLKRGYPRVGCRVTEIDGEGKRIRARLIVVDAPRAYTLRLSEDGHPDCTSFMVEFFAADNLFIPFPAVMVNHRGDGFLNSVHSYNRVLNDVFEDDAINVVSQREAAIDVRIDESVSTFLVLSAGQSRCEGSLDVRLDHEGCLFERTVPVSVPRLNHRVIGLREIFPELNRVGGGVLTVQQPHQPMFYGRMLVGRVADDGAFSANHSYYDSSHTREYWEDARPSIRLYPFLHALDNRLRFYPILSPGRLGLVVVPHDKAGHRLARIEVGVLESPSGRPIDFSVNDACRTASVDVASVSTFAVEATPLEGGTPTRVNHQLVYGGGGLESSINMSLTNPNVFVPAGKAGFTWGQLPIGDAFESWLAVTTNEPGGEGCDAELSCYDESGLVGERRLHIPAGAATILAPEELLPDAVLTRAQEKLEYVWFELRAKRSDVYGYAISRHRRTGHCSGEHSF
jgi:hypothetical protein